MAKKKKAKRNTTSIVIGHLENISSGIFERFKDEITQMIQGNFGIYALYKKHHLYYIGLATNFRARLTQHLKDRITKRGQTPF